VGGFLSRLEAQGFHHDQWCVVVACDGVVSLSSEATAATAASAIPIEIMAAVDRPGAGAEAAGAAGAGAAVSGAACAKAWPDTKAIMANTEIIFFILKSFSLKKQTSCNITSFPF
jgi:hypothetical protein